MTIAMGDLVSAGRVCATRVAIGVMWSKPARTRLAIRMFLFINLCSIATASASAHTTPALSRFAREIEVRRQRDADGVAIGPHESFRLPAEFPWLDVLAPEGGACDTT